MPRRRERYLIPVAALTFCKPAVQGADRVLDYLGRYVHRTALSGKAIVACDDETVTFLYRRSGQSARRAVTLPAAELLRRFLQHVPPKGFHRVRAFGLLHPSRRTELRRIQLLLGGPAVAEPCAAHAGIPGESSNAEERPSAKRPSRLRCRGCGQGSLRLVRRLSAEQCAAWESAGEAEEIERARAPP